MSTETAKTSIEVVQPSRPSDEDLLAVREWILFSLLEYSSDDPLTGFNFVYGISRLKVRRPDQELLDRVRPWIVGVTFDWAREDDLCDDVANYLAHIFNIPLGDVRDATGRDYNRFDRDGFNEEGFDQNGRDRDGLDEDGYDRNGRDRDGFSRWHPFTNTEGVTREQWQQRPQGIFERLVADGKADDVFQLLSEWKLTADGKADAVLQLFSERKQGQEPAS